MIYNVDETGFSIGSSRKSVVLLDQLNQRQEKKQPGRQEWITCLVCQCFGGDPASVPNFQRRKPKFRLDSRRDSSRLEVHYIEKGWTSDLIRFEWLKAHFQPFVSKSTNLRHLLIIDGHSSHVTAWFIIFCITSKIDLFLLLPHFSHKMQPLDLSIFRPLKTVLNLEVD
jgi:hypothetical protein